MNDGDTPAPDLLSDSFSFAHPTLLFPEARLYEDRLELTGWRLWGQYSRRIPLHRILHADAVGSTDLLLWMADGETLRLSIGNADRWQREIRERLDN